MRRRGALWLLLAGALPAAALDLGLSGLNTARYGAGTVLDPQGGELDRVFREDLLDVDVSWKAFRLNLAGAAYAAAELPDARAEDDRVREVALIRRSLEWTGPVTVRLGHGWTTFGNGLALSLYRDDELEHPRLTGTLRDETPTTWDSGLDGVMASGDWEHVSFTALWGGAGPFDDPGYYGELAGVNAEWHLAAGTFGGSWVRAAGAPVNIQDADPDLLDVESRELYGRLQLGPVELTLDHVDQHRKDNLLAVYAPTAGKGGVATYAALGGELAGWYLQAEYKYYRYALRQLYLTNPPIVQREIPTRLIARHRRLNFFDDEVGVQLEASRWFDGGQELTLQAAVSSHLGDGLLPVLEEAFSAYREFTAGWAQELGGERHLALSLAWTEETSGWVEGGRPRADAEWTRRAGGGAALRTPLPLLRSLEIAGEALRIRELEAGETRLATLLWMDVFPYDRVSLNLTADWEEDSDTDRDWMASTEIRWDLPGGGPLEHSLTVFAGRLRGGLVCSSGNCRIVAPFDGVKLTLVSRF